MIAPPSEIQWFIVRGWLDAQEWEDEPPDPDDVWAVGDRVRLKGSTVEGTVHSSEQHPFLGGYLNLNKSVVGWKANSHSSGARAINSYKEIHTTKAYMESAAKFFR